MHSGEAKEQSFEVQCILEQYPNILGDMPKGLSPSIGFEHAMEMESRGIDEIPRFNGKDRQREVLASHIGHRGGMALHARHKEGLAPNIEPGIGLASHVEHQGAWAPNIGQKGELAREESWISHVDTPKRYESNSDFHGSNSEILHDVVESNNFGKREERAIVVSYLVSKCDMWEKSILHVNCNRLIAP